MSTIQDGGTRDAVDALVADLRERFGDGLRSVVVYDDSGAGTRFARDDISEAEMHARLERVRTLYRAERSVRDTDDLDPEFGRLHASTHVFGAAIVVHLLRPDGTAVGLSMDHVIGSRLSTFVRECHHRLRAADGEGT